MQDSATTSSAAATPLNQNSKRTRPDGGQEDNKLETRTKFYKAVAALSTVKSKLNDVFLDTTDYLPVKRKERKVVSVELVQEIKTKVEELLAIVPGADDDTRSARETWDKKSETIQATTEDLLQQAEQKVEQLSTLFLRLTNFVNGPQWVPQLARKVRGAADQIGKLVRCAATVGYKYPVLELQALLRKQLGLLDLGTIATTSRSDLKSVIGCCEELLEDLANPQEEDDDEEAESEEEDQDK
jgi:hypothetical protein